MSAAHSLTDRRRVYLACRAIFTGKNASLRKSKKVSTLINRHQSDLGSLVEDIGAPNIVQISHDLLLRKIFSSEVKAKVEFPDLFQPSPERDVEHEESEHDAELATEEALERFEEEQEESEDALVEAESSQPLDDMPNFEGPHQVPLRPGSSVNTLSLYPSFLPYGTQHLVLTTTQRIVEECCFDFAKQHMPTLLASKRWDCPEAVELTAWTRIIARATPKLPAHALDLDRGTSITQFLLPMSRLRNTAVHRLPTPARGIGQLVHSSMLLAQTLRDPARAARLKDLHAEIAAQVRAMEMSKSALEADLAGQLEQIEVQRAELERREKELKDRVVKEDSENKALIGSVVQESVRRIFEEGGAGEEEVENGDGDEEVETGADRVNGGEEEPLEHDKPHLDPEVMAFLKTLTKETPKKAEPESKVAANGAKGNGYAETAIQKVKLDGKPSALVEEVSETDKPASDITAEKELAEGIFGKTKPDREASAEEVNGLARETAEKNEPEAQAEEREGGLDATTKELSGLEEETVREEKPDTSKPSGLSQKTAEKEAGNGELEGVVADAVEEVQLDSGASNKVVERTTDKKKPIEGEMINKDEPTDGAPNRHSVETVEEEKVDAGVPNEVVEHGRSETGVKQLDGQAEETVENEKPKEKGRGWGILKLLR